MAETKEPHEWVEEDEGKLSSLVTRNLKLGLYLIGEKWVLFTTPFFKMFELKAKTLEEAQLEAIQVIKTELKIIDAELSVIEIPKK